MTDRPIIFSAPMVRALLDGRKTQTRRVLKPPYCALEYLRDGSWRPICTTKFFPGDRLWVREACKPIPASKPGGYFVPGSPFYGVEWFYRADGNCPLWADGKWRPSIHMPRWASRLTLTVTEVRVQRLQEISEADAMAEGGIGESGEASCGEGYCDAYWFNHGQLHGESFDTARDSYSDLWNSLHGPDAWSANPWVVAVSFTVEQRNIDA